MGTARMTFVGILFLPVAKTATVSKVKSVALTAAIPHLVGVTPRRETHSAPKTVEEAFVSKTSVQMWIVFRLRLPATEIGPYREPSLPVTLTLESVFTQPEPLPKIVEAWG